MATKKEIRNYAEKHNITREEARKYFIDEAIKRNKVEVKQFLAIRHMSNGLKEMSFFACNEKEILKNFKQFTSEQNMSEQEARNQMLGFITQQRWNHCENHAFALSAYAVTSNSYQMMKDMIDADKCLVMNFYEQENSCRHCYIIDKDDAINQIEDYKKSANIDVAVHS